MLNLIISQSFIKIYEILEKFCQRRRQAKTREKYKTPAVQQVITLFLLSNLWLFLYFISSNDKCETIAINFKFYGTFQNYHRPLVVWFPNSISLGTTDLNRRGSWEYVWLTQVSRITNHTNFTNCAIFLGYKQYIVVVAFLSLSPSCRLKLWLLNTVRPDN